MLIVVVCLGIIAIMVLPTAADTQQDRLRAAAKRLISDLEFAHIASLGNSVDPYVIVFNTASDTYHVAQSSDPATPIPHPALAEPYSTTFGSGSASFLDGVVFDSLDIGGDGQLAYTHAGSIDQASDAHVTLRCDALTIQITIDASTGEPVASW